MRWTLLLLAFTAPAWAGAGKDSQREPGRQAEDKALVARSPETWLRVYSLPIYRENWTLEMSVKSLRRGRPRVKEVFARLGASMPAPEGAPEAGGVLTYHCTRKTALEALAQLRALGKVSQPAVRPILEPVSLPEVQRKIKLLEADQAGHPGQLSAMPAVSELVGEVLDHLRTVEAALLKPDGAVLLRLALREER
ncbi:MAG: hypothetical protein PHF00_01505 [Elusimicrobia bacterium]|nr:hypothetical protein [Elusimicrobiota bacterium]